MSRGIWLGHYFDDGVDVSVWFAAEGEALFSTWGYVENEISRISIEAMCDAELYRISKADLEAFFAESVEAATSGGGFSNSSSSALKTGYFRAAPRGPKSVTGH